MHRDPKLKNMVKRPLTNTKNQPNKQAELTRAQAYRKSEAALSMCKERAVTCRRYCAQGPKAREHSEEGFPRKNKETGRTCQGLYVSETEACVTTVP